MRRRRAIRVSASCTSWAILSAEAKTQESQVVSTFLRGILEGNDVQLHYRSPYKSQATTYTVVPTGVIWDRDWWYLVGQRQAQKGAALRLWRADRVLSIELRPRQRHQQTSFDVNQLLGRTWLREAMTKWTKDAPVKLRITPQQAARLKLDWYYRYAHYEELADGQVLMTFGEAKPEYVLDLVRWLGPGAELVEPLVWCAQLREELATMLALYTD